MLPFVILWARHDAGLSGSAAGLLFVAQAIGELTGGLIAGMLADRLGHRRILLTATIGMAVGYGSLFGIHHSVVAVAAFFIAGLFESAFHPTVLALIGDIKAGPDLRKSFGVARVCANVGKIAGPLIGAAAATRSLPTVFAVTAVMLGAAVVALAISVPGDSAMSAEEAAGDDADAGSAAALATIFRDGRLGQLVLAGGLLSITLTWFEADGLVLLRAQHPLSTTAYAALFAIAAAGPRWSPSASINWSNN